MRIQFFILLFLTFATWFVTSGETPTTEDQTKLIEIKKIGFYFIHGDKVLNSNWDFMHVMLPFGEARSVFNTSWTFSRIGTAMAISFIISFFFEAFLIPLSFSALYGELIFMPLSILFGFRLIAIIPMIICFGISFNKKLLSIKLFNQKVFEKQNKN